MPKPILLLDVMNTLVYDPFYREVPAFLGLSFERLLAEKHPRSWLEFELDRIDEETLYATFFADGRAINGPGLKAHMHSSYRWLDGIEALLGELQTAGCVCHALSNYPRWYQLIEQRLGLSRYLEWRFVSCNTGVRKPQAEAYLGAARSLDVSPADCLLVDDRAANCEGAQSAGMPALLFSDAAQLRASLQDRQLLPR